MSELLKGIDELVRTRIWPTNFEIRNEFSKEEKECARYFFKNGFVENFVLGVNPTGKGKLKRISYSFSKSDGIRIFYLIDANKEKMLEYIKFYIEQLEELQEEIIYRLLNSAMLIRREKGKKSLTVPFNMYVVFQGISYSSLRLKDKKNIIDYEDKILFKNFINLKGETIYEKKRQSIILTESQCNAIVERLSPEYTIVINEKESVEKANSKIINYGVNKIQLDITGNELENKIFALDDEQINLINEIRYGHRLILANPGAGKSVILLAKAFKMSKLYEKDNVLVTCYNNNLAEAYCFRRDYSGINNDNNLFILTFHKLVLKALKEKLHLSFGINDFDKALDVFEAAVDNGKIDLEFKAIFIDEVQVFEPRWLDICYKLLKKDEENIFLIAGDLNQNVKSMSSKGKAVWQQMNQIPSDFKGRVKYIRKNYRNTYPICTYINSQLNFMTDKMKEMNIVLTDDFDVTTFGSSSKLGGKVDLKLNVNKYQFKNEIKSKIKEINKKDNIDFSDIAIIIPFKQHKTFVYYPLVWIKQALEEEGIEYRIICNDSGYKNKFDNGNGVVISTIDSALGLDFKAVVLTALYPLAYIYDNNKAIKIKSWDEIRTKEIEVKEQYFRSLRKIYTASSRAREYLYILSDIVKDSPINDFLSVGNKNE